MRSAISNTAVRPAGLQIGHGPQFFSGLCAIPKDRPTGAEQSPARQTHSAAMGRRTSSDLLGLSKGRSRRLHARFSAGGNRSARKRVGTQLRLSIIYGRKQPWPPCGRREGTKPSLSAVGRTQAIFGSRVFVWSDALMRFGESVRRSRQGVSHASPELLPKPIHIGGALRRRGVLVGLLRSGSEQRERSCGSRSPGRSPWTTSVFRPD